jgi:hypothetical protein
MRQLTDKGNAREITTGVAILIDGIWLRHAKSSDNLNSQSAINFIEEYVDRAIGAGSDDRRHS